MKPSTCAAARSIVNALTIDVEDYFQVSAFAPHIARSDWDSAAVPRRAQRRPHPRAARRARTRSATFFTLGWIAERYPRLVRAHRRARPRAGEPRLRPPARERAERGAVPRRHPPRQGGARRHRGRDGAAATARRAFRSATRNLWAFDCIAEAGYRYSSSVYPIRHDHYGMPDAPRFAHEVRPGLLEVPVATVRMLGRNWPAGGGGYFRLLPYARVALVARPRQRASTAAGDLLLPSVGDRSRPAARRGHRR